VLTATFELAGAQYFALNGGPLFKFTEQPELSNLNLTQALHGLETRIGR
jgi:predicted 3-demethylubiquinone-9 3-methyltransferase (glyoxalase superfamily)